VGVLGLAKNEAVGEEDFFEVLGSFVRIWASGIGRPGRVLEYSGLELVLNRFSGRPLFTGT